MKIEFRIQEAEAISLLVQARSRSTKLRFVVNPSGFKEAIVYFRYIFKHTFIGFL
jgi:hypothetical protein